MKKIKQLLLGNIKVIIGFIIGAIISGSTVYALTIFINANQIAYDKTNSGLISSNVQEVLNEIYYKTTSEDYLLEKYQELIGIPTNYLNDGNNAPTTESPTTPPEGKSVYLALYADGEYGVCVKRKGVQHCFVHGNYIVESKHLLEVFPDATCTYSTSDGYNCYARDHWCSVRPSGVVVCDDTLRICGVGLYSATC